MKEFIIHSKDSVRKEDKSTVMSLRIIWSFRRNMMTWLPKAAIPEINLCAWHFNMQ